MTTPESVIMGFGPVTNSVLMLLVGGVGLFVGYYSLRSSANQADTPPLSEKHGVDKRQLSVNVAILYATLMLVISAVVSEWPPEGQATLPILEEIIFFGSIAAAAVIIGRVIYLISAIESELNL